MAVVTQRPSHIRYTKARHDRPPQQTNSHKRALLVPPLFRVSLFGGLCLTMLILINLIPVPNPLAGISLVLLTLAASFVICLAIGSLAALLSGDCVNCTRKGGEVAWMAGFWAGIIAAIIAMLLAANGLLLVDFGQSLVNLRTPEQLELLSSIISIHSLAFAGRVSGVLLYGLIGSLMSALVSAVGGMVCFKLI